MHISKKSSTFAHLSVRAMKKVTVIMPNYNHAPYLKERMESIFSQNYPEFEIILLDDASTDDSAAILREYAKDPRVKTLIVNESNSGNTFLQWERGLKEATGEYIWIAESDDVAEPAFLSRMVNAIERDKAVLAFCHSQWIDSEGKPIERSRDTRWNRDFLMAGFSFVKQYLLAYNNICNASAVLFRRDAAQQVDMAQVAQFTASGDRLFWIRLALQGRVAFVSEALNRFRQHAQKVSGSAEEKGLNIIQDHEIYRLIAPELSLTGRDKHVICGYHWKATQRPTVSEEGRASAIEAWSAEPEFGRLSFLMYLLQRAKDKC